MIRLIRSAAATAALSALVALAGPAAAAPRPGPAAPPPRAQLRGFTCRRALDPGTRSVSVTAVMRPLPGTRRLQLRFELLARTAGAASPSLVSAGDLGVWISPRDLALGRLPGDVWKLDKPVVDLGAPATYRFRVAFRWIGAGGRVIGSATRYSRRCRQPELRPDLQVSSIAVGSIAGRPARDLYTVTIVNAGASGAGPFDVLFAPGDGSATGTRTIQWLKGEQSRTVYFVGSRCTAAAAPLVTVDSAAQVDDLDRANNQLTADCPAPAAI